MEIGSAVLDLLQGDKHQHSGESKRNSVKFRGEMATKLKSRAKIHCKLLSVSEISCENIELCSANSTNMNRQRKTLSNKGTSLNMYRMKGWLGQHYCTGRHVASDLQPSLV